MSFDSTPFSFQYPRVSRQSIYDAEELSVMELAARLVVRFNEVLAEVATVDSRIAAKEDSINITNNRKLSPTGNFTGTWMGKPLEPILIDIADALSLCQTLINMVNDRESIGTIYDGGYFVETDPPTIIIEGGMF